MRARTEDLLTIRDGEPIDAALRERLVADPENLREIERLDRIREELLRLPDLAPPPGVFERVAAAALPPRPPSRAGTRRAFGLAIAAGLAAAALVWAYRVTGPSGPERDPPALRTADERVVDPPGAGAPVLVTTSPEIRSAAEIRNSLVIRSTPEITDTLVGGSTPVANRLRYRNPLAETRAPGADERASADPFVIAPRSTAGEPSSRWVQAASYAPLVEESVRLERLLARFEQPQLMSVGTATTIAGLEDRIVVLDEQLSFAVARGADDSERRALWQERVDVMNALLQVRYAQSR